MTFLHKLASRLARLKGRSVPTAAAVVAVVAAGCERALPLATDPGTTVAQVLLFPQAITLQPSQIQDFRAVGLTATGDTAKIAVAWRATGGTIDTSSIGGRHYGHYTATTCGTNQVTATSTPGAMTAAAAVIVSCTPVSIATVVVSPASVTLLVGKTLPLVATPEDSAGNALGGRPVTWSSSPASVATVDGTGLVTAVAAGSATITATAGGKSGTAAITVTAVPVASVSVSPASTSVPVGSTAQLTATPKDASGIPLTGRVVTWASSNLASATVNTSGLVTGVAAGSATITATSEGQSGTAAITVTAVPVASVSVTPASATVQVGLTVQLTASPKDANGTPLSGRVVTWASGNTAVATVNASGLVTGMAAGSATITATSEGQSGTAAITVTTVPVASVSVSPASTSVPVRSTAQLTATPKDAAGNPLTGRVVTWASGNTAVATVNASGLVTGMAAGSATITATSEGQSGTAAITVTTVPVASVTVTPASASVPVGSTAQLTATLKDAAGNPLTGRVVTWASGNTAVATVNASGLVTGMAAGSATITATSEGKSGTAAITVTAVPVASVTVTPASASVPVGSTAQLTATPKDAAGNPLTGRVVTWASGNTAVATVNASGLVTGVAAGSVTVTATSEGKSGTAAITVTPPVSGSFGVGNWPTAGYHPYAANAWINRPLPANPALDPNSASEVAAFTSHGPPLDRLVGPGTNDYMHPIYWSTGADPVYTISGITTYGTNMNGVQFHGLVGMKVAGGSDAHLCVMDQSTGIEYDFWQAVVNDNAKTIGGSSGGRLTFTTGDARVVMGPDGAGANAANTGLWTGQIRGVELFAGVITHPIAVIAAATNGSWVYPATGPALGGGSSEPADGQFFQLTYSDAEIDALPVAAWKKIVLHAMHQYGFYIDDTGSGAHMFDIHFESGKTYEAFGYEDPFVTYAKQNPGQDIVQSGSAYYYQLAPGVDWTRIQVIAPSVIQTPH